MEEQRVPKWAADKRSLYSVSLGLGAGFAALLTAISFTAFGVIGSSVTAAFTFVVPSLLVAAVIVLITRRVVLGPARNQSLPVSKWLVAYVLAALPMSFAAICLIVLAAIAWAFNWQLRFAFVQALILLVLLFFVVSMTAKIIFNAQLLIRHWSQGKSGLGPLPPAS